MDKMGKGLMGTGEAEGENRAIIACEEAISNPLLDDISIRGAKGVLVNMTGGTDMTLFEADLAVNTIKKEVDDNANIIFGSAFNPDMEGKIRISVVATGIEDNEFYNSDFNENLLKTTSQMVHEVDNVENEEKNIVEAAMQDKKTFFDPGLAKETKDNSLKISQIDTQDANLDQNDISSGNDSAAEDFGNEIFAEDNGFVESSDEEDMKQNRNSDLLQDSFVFGDENFVEKDPAGGKFGDEKDIFDLPDEEVRKFAAEAQEENRPKKKSKNKDKFSLFGFMNNFRSENKVDEAQKKQNVKKEEGKESEKPEKNLFSDQDNDFFVGESDNLVKKMAVENDDEFTEDKDDVLNVPAFFRRKD